jgi:hypothetical protein
MLAVEPATRAQQAKRSIGAMPAVLPDRAPFVLRARVLTPLAAGGSRYEPDGVVVVEAGGRKNLARPTSDR